MRRWLLAVVLALPAAGCGLVGGQGAAGDVTAPPTVVSTATPTVARTDVPLDPVGPVRRAQTDVWQRNQFSTVKVNGVSSQGNVVAVEIKATNGVTGEVQLNNDGVYLYDDLGNAYPFVPARENQRLQLPSGGTLTGELVFHGPVADQASSLRLVFNAPEYVAESGLGEDLRYGGDEGAPTFELDGLPVPRAGAPSR